MVRESLKSFFKENREDLKNISIMSPREIVERFPSIAKTHREANRLKEVVSNKLKKKD